MHEQSNDWHSQGHLLENKARTKSGAGALVIQWIASLLSSSKVPPCHELGQEHLGSFEDFTILLTGSWPGQYAVVGYSDMVVAVQIQDHP